MLNLPRLLLSIAFSVTLAGCLDANVEWNILDSGSSAGGGATAPVGPFGISAPPAGGYVGGTSTLAGSCYSAGLSQVTVGGTGITSSFTVPCQPDDTFSTPITLTGGDGTKNVTISQLDPLGATVNDNRNMTKDTTAPAITIVSPGGGATVPGALTVTGACESGLAVTLSGSSSPSPTTTACVAGSFSQAITLGASDGFVILTASQVDGAGNVASPGVALTKDSVAPSVAFSSPAAMAIVGASVNISGTCENGSLVNVGGTGAAAPAAFSCTAGAFSATMPLTAGDGAKNITLSQTDAAGNTGTANRDFVRDGTAPAIVIFLPGAGTPVQGAVTVNGSCETGLTVNISGTSNPSPATTSCVAGAFSQALTLAAADGSRTIVVAQTDGAGNTGSTATSVSKDTVSPTVTITAPGAGTTTPGTLGLSGTCEMGLVVTFGGTGHASPASATCVAGLFSATITMTAGDGAKNITATQTDAAGNSGSANRSFVRDGTAPTVSFSAPVAGSEHQSSVTVSGSCETGLPVSLSGTASPSPTSTACSAGAYSQLVTLGAADGTVTLVIGQTDGAGNPGSSSRTIIKDTVVPAPTIGSPTNGATVQGTTLLTGTCETGRTVSITGSSGPTPTSTLCPSGTFSQTVTLTGSEGAGSLNVAQTDAAGNTGSSVIVVTKDTLPPAIAITAPAAGALSTGSVSLVGTCQTGLIVSLSGTGHASPATTSCTAGAFSTVVTLASGDGTKNIVVSQTDTAGNTGTDNRNFTRDATAPVLSFSSPAASSTHQSGVTVSGACESGLTITLSGTSNPSPTSFACTAGAFSQFVILGSSDGSITLIVSQTDAAGNTGSSTRSINKDTTPPTIVLTTPTNAATVGATVLATGTCETGLSVTFGGSALPSPASTACSSGSFSELLTLGASDGAVTLNAGQTDAAGNPSSIGIGLAKDTSVPTVAITAPAAGTFSIGTLTVSGTCETGFNVDLAGAGNALSASTPCTAGAFSASVTLTAGDGSKLITASQTDGALNTTSVNRSFNRDNTAPVVTFATPGTQYGGQNAALSFSSVDAGVGTNILEIDFAPDGVTYGTQYGVASSATSLSYPMPMVNTATGTFRLHTTDLLGNTTTVTRSPVPVLTVLGLFPSAAKWNEYFKASNPTVGCTGVETGSPNPCIHGGDKLAVIAGNRASCSNLTADDTLGAFDWRCEIIGGNPYLTSRLKQGKGLRDLLTSAPAWATNRVTIRDSGSAIYVTPLTTWWLNAVMPLPPSSSAPVALAGSGQIFVATAPMTSRGYNIGSDRIALVTLAGAKLTANAANLPLNCNDLTGETTPPDAQCLIAAGSQSFLWIEADLDGVSNSGSNSGIALSGVKFSVVQHSRFVNMGIESIILKGGSRFNRVQKIKVANSYYGLTVSGSSDNTFSGYMISNGSSTDVGLLYLEAPATGNSFNGFVIHGGGGADAIQTADVAGSYAGNSFTLITVANMTKLGLDFFGLQDSFVHNALLVGNGLGGGVGEGLSLGAGTSQQVTNNTFSQLAVGDSKVLVSLYTGVTGNKFTGNLLLGTFTTSQCSGGGATAGINATCGPTGTSDFVRRTGVAVSGAVLAKVATTDPLNLSNSGGSSSFGSITDWLGFSNAFRGWGKDGGVFPLAANQGACSSGTCRIWDWRLKNADTQVRNTSGDGFNQNSSFVAGSACPTEADGNAYLSNPPDGVFYLKSAVEILNDDTGNDNGLCESGEICLYTPNFGAYQGEGSLGQCIFNNGAVSGVTLLGYLTNGG